LKLRRPSRRDTPDHRDFSNSEPPKEMENISILDTLGLTPYLSGRKIGVAPAIGRRQGGWGMKTVGRRGEFDFLTSAADTAQGLDNKFSTTRQIMGL
jgi:hypothetical protein